MIFVNIVYNLPKMVIIFGALIVVMRLKFLKEMGKLVDVILAKNYLGENIRH